MSKPTDYTRRANSRSVTIGAYYLHYVDGQRPYLDLGFDTKKEAEAALVDLLKPYPKKHPWRRQIIVAKKLTTTEVSPVSDDPLSPDDPWGLRSLKKKRRRTPG